MGLFDSILGGGNGNNRITINGETFEVSGKNIVVKDSQVIVDGKVVKGGLSGNVHVIFEGDLASLDCNSCTINGNVQGNIDANSVHCGNVGGDIDANSVHCNTATGNINM